MHSSQLHSTRSRHSHRRSSCGPDMHRLQCKVCYTHADIRKWNAPFHKPFVVSIIGEAMGRA